MGFVFLSFSLAQTIVLESYAIDSRLVIMLCVVINVHTILILSCLYRISDAQVVRVEREVN